MRRPGSSLLPWSESTPPRLTTVPVPREHTGTIISFHLVLVKDAFLSFRRDGLLDTTIPFERAALRAQIPATNITKLIDLKGEQKSHVAS